MSWWTVLWYGKNSAKVAEERGDYAKASELYEKESKRRIPNPVSQASCARNRDFYYPSIPANDSYGKVSKAAECARKAGLYDKADELYDQIIKSYNGSYELSDSDLERIKQHYPPDIAEKIELRVREGARMGILGREMRQIVERRKTPENIVDSLIGSSWPPWNSEGVIEEIKFIKDKNLRHKVMRQALEHCHKQQGDYGYDSLRRNLEMELGIKTIDGMREEIVNKEICDGCHEPCFISESKEWQAPGGMLMSLCPNCYRERYRRDITLQGINSSERMAKELLIDRIRNHG